jgi:hypothetical protein
MYELSYLQSLQHPFNYAAVATLYEQLGTNSLLKQLAKVRNSYTENALKTWLEGQISLLLHTPLVVQQTENLLTAQAAAKGKSTLPSKAQNEQQKPLYSLNKYAHAPAEVHALAEQLRTCYKEQDALFHRLRNFPTNEERRQAALRILDLDATIQQGWLDLFHYDSYQRLPPPPVPSKPPKVILTDRADLAQRKATLLKNISRDKKKRPHKVAQWEEELAEVLNLLAQ